MVIIQNGIKRRQLFNDLFIFINDNKYQFDINIFNQLEIKLMSLWIANEQSYKICKFWKRNGCCPYGAKCRFQHFTLVKHDEQCQFYNNNNCNRGRDCHYMHNSNDNPFNFNHKFNERNNLPPIPTSIITINQQWINSTTGHKHDHNYNHNHNNCNHNHNENHKNHNHSHNHVSHKSLPTITETSSTISKISVIDTHNNNNDCMVETMRKEENILDVSKKNCDMEKEIERNKEIFEKKEDILDISKENNNCNQGKVSINDPSPLNVIDSIDNNIALEKKENILDISQENSDMENKDNFEEKEYIPDFSKENSEQNNNSNNKINKNTMVSDPILEASESQVLNIINSLDNNTALETISDTLEVSSASSVNTTNTHDTDDTNTDDMEETDIIDDTDDFNQLINMFDAAMELINQKSYCNAWDILNKLLNAEKFKIAVKYHDFLFEAYLMMSFLYKNIGKYQQALNVLSIDKVLRFPQDIQDTVDRERNILYQLQDRESTDRYYYKKF